MLPGSQTERFGKPNMQPVILRFEADGKGASIHGRTDGLRLQPINGL